MDYEYYLNKLGSKFSLVRGEFVEDPQGAFTVTTEFKQYSIYVNKQTKKVAPIAPTKSYLARTYVLRKSDCITLMFEWLDDHYNTKYIDFYNSISHRYFLKYYKAGLGCWYEDSGFKKVDIPQAGDCIVYGDSINEVIPNNHVGICVGDNKILHHLPQRYSSIDTIISDKVIGCYRYGN